MQTNLLTHQFMGHLQRNQQPKIHPYAPNDKIPPHLKQNTVYKWSCPKENCNHSHIGKSSRCLENRTKEHNNHITSAFYQHSVSNSHPRANISHLKITDQDSKQVAREARESILIRINNCALNDNTGKMYIPEIFNNLLGADGSTNESNQMGDSDCTQGHTYLNSKQQVFPEECV